MRPVDGTDDDNNINHVPRCSVRSPHRVRGRSDERPAHAHGLWTWIHGSRVI